MTKFLSILFFLFFCSYSNASERNVARQPNLLVIQTDEHNIRTLGCYRELLGEELGFQWGKGIAVETPNLDRLANEGAICTNYYSSSPVCTPSRASFQTGLYPIAAGCPINGMPMFRNLKTFADVLKDAGYSTSYVGKWHLTGNIPKGVSEDEYTYPFGYTDCTWRFDKSAHGKWVTVDWEHKTTERSYVEPANKDSNLYITDFLTNRTLEILDRDKDKPFCLMVSFPNPHSPDISREPYKTRYANLQVEEPSTMKPDLAAKRPLWAVGGKSEIKEFDAKSVREYFGMVKCIDDNIGRILKFLDDNGLTDNTIVVFTSDHGDMLFEHHRKDKGVPYEASAKIPFLIRYPGKISEGKIIGKCYTTCDFPPTILGLMGQQQLVGVHGIDDSKFFLNSEKVASSDRIVYITDSPFNEWTAATDGKYKLVLSCQDTPWFFDLEKDPYELVNRYTDPSYHDTVARFQQELLNQMKTYDEPALKLGLKYCLNADDDVTYKGPYWGVAPTDVVKIEAKVLENQINLITEKCFK